MHDGLTLFFDLFGTFVFALTGAIKGVKNRLDFLGVIVFSITVGCCGGIIRDLMLGNLPVTILTSYWNVVASIMAGLIVFFISPVAIGRWRLIPYVDAVGLGFFTALGCTIAYDLGFGFMGILFSGIVTAVGGGVMRDVFSHEIPMVFTSDFYASASIIGALLFYALIRLGVPSALTLWIIAALTTTLRILGYHYRWKLPVARLASEER